VCVRKDKLLVMSNKSLFLLYFHDHIICMEFSVTPTSWSKDKIPIFQIKNVGYGFAYQDAIINVFRLHSSIDFVVVNLLCEIVVNVINQDCM
jgi:hypothetical protein